MRVAEALRAGIEGIGRRLGYPAGLITVSIGLAEFDPRPARRATCWWRPTGRCTGPRRRAGTRWRESGMIYGLHRQSQQLAGSVNLDSDAMDRQP